MTGWNLARDCYGFLLGRLLEWGSGIGVLGV